jgi:hypothetical protein
MASELFNKMVQLVESNVDNIDAHSVVDQSCRQIGLLPDDLRFKHIGQLLIKLMSNLDGQIPKTDWYYLDRSFKKIFREKESLRARVKGNVLSSVQDFVTRKRGSIIFDQINDSINIPKSFKEEKWYPIILLDAMLIKADTIFLESSGINPWAVGHDIIFQKGLPNGYHLFGREQLTIVDAFNNIGEIIILENFSLRERDGVLGLYFENEVSDYCQEFMRGICDAILKIRNIYTSRVEVISKGDYTIIDLGTLFEEKGVAR